MADFFNKLPSILILAVLVGIFVALRRHVKSARLNLWTAAWVLIFIHFFVGIFEPRQGNLQNILETINWGALQVSATCFVASLTSFVEDKTKTRTLLALTAVPVFIYTAAASFATNGSQFRPLYTICLVVAFFGTAAFLSLRRGNTPVVLAWIPILVVTGGWAIYKVWRNDPDTGFNAFLTLGFGAPAFLFWRRYRRWSPGVITSAGGFLLWGLVFPIGVLTDIYFPNAHINGEIWNVPKFFVAFGMILTLLEDKSQVLEITSRREHKLNEQLQKFASITSRLLTGVEVNSLCDEIAHAITETSNFRRAIILLGTDDKGMYMAGHSGLSEDAVVQLRKFTPQWRIEDVAEVCRAAAKIGANSYLMSPEQVQKYTPLREGEEFVPNPYWK